MAVRTIKTEIKERSKMYCQECEKRDSCTVMCKEVDNYLNRKDEDRLYSDRHIRRMEVPYDPYFLDEMLPMEAIRRLKGKRKANKYREKG